MVALLRATRKPHGFLELPDVGAFLACPWSTRYSTGEVVQQLHGTWQKLAEDFGTCVHQHDILQGLVGNCQIYPLVHFDVRIKAAG